MTAPNPWPVPDAAVDAALHEMDPTWPESTKHMRAAILAALPLLGIAELLDQAANAFQSIGTKARNKVVRGAYFARAARLRDAAARMKVEA